MAAPYDTSDGAPVSLPDVSDTIRPHPLFSYPTADRAFPVATQAAAEVLSLPCFPELTDGEVDEIVGAVKQAAREVL